MLEDPNKSPLAAPAHVGHAHDPQVIPSQLKQRCNKGRWLCRYPLNSTMGLGLWRCDWLPLSTSSITSAKYRAGVDSFRSECVTIPACSIGSRWPRLTTPNLSLSFGSSQEGTASMGKALICGRRSLSSAPSPGRKYKWGCDITGSSRLY